MTTDSIMQTPDGESVTASTTPAQAPRHWLPKDLGTWSPVIAFALVFVIFGTWKTNVFLTRQNLLTILNDNADLATMSFGLTVVLLTGEFDLSIGAIAGFSGFLSAGFIAHQGLATPESVVVVVLIGACIGWINGALIVYGRVNALIVTLAMSSILAGLTFYYSNGQVLYTGIPHSFDRLGLASVGQLSAPTFYMIAIGLLLWAMLRYTATGRYLHAIGGNREASRLSGIHVERRIIQAFIISGVCASIAGIAETARNTSADPTVGPSFLLPAFAAAFLGSATLRRGEFHIVGTAIGVFLIATATSGLFILGAPDYTSDFLSGGLLLAATAGTRLLDIRRSSIRIRRPIRPPGRDPEATALSATSTPGSGTSA
jgi:ribose transport system permease protein